MSPVSAAGLASVGFAPDEVARRLTLFQVVGRGWADLSPDRSPELAFHVPGRIEVLGKHTDYAGGRSLVTATEQGLAVLASPRTDRVVRIVDARRAENRSFSIDPQAEAPRGDWANYPVTVTRRFATDFGAANGFDLVFASDLPFAAGVSSSSAIVVAVALVLIESNRLAEHPLYRANISSRGALGGYLGAVENGKSFGALGGSGGVGTMGGSQDQTAILCSRANALVQYRFDPVRHERTVEWPDDLVFAVAASGVVAEKTGNVIEHYNGLARMTARLAEMARVISAGAYPTLGAALIEWNEGPERLADHLRTLPPAERGPLDQRLTQLAAECRTIIPGVAAALQRHDLTTLGALVEASQRGAEMGLRNQIPETVQLVDLAIGAGAVAASAFGAGFGGSVWAMLERASAREFVDRWREGYLARFPEHRREASIVLTRPAPPASRILG